MPAVALLAVVLGAAALRASVHYDFVAFYCAGDALTRGNDPYLLGSLAACEAAVRGTHVVVPAPLPPQAIFAFGALSRLGFPAAAAVWDAATVALFTFTAVALARLARLSVATPALALAVPLLYSSLLSGQIVPWLVAGIAGSALAARRGAYPAAALFALVTTVEPHVGAFVCLGLAVACPRTRATLAAGALALAALAAAAMGPAGLGEYAFAVLPAHARSELVHQGQFSLSYALHALGVPGGTALAAGAFSTALSAGIGIAVARRAVRRTGNDAYAATIPAAFALAGGSFMHVVQMVAAVPLAVMLAAEPALSQRARLALATLATPFADPTSVAPVAAVCGAVSGALAWSARRRTLAAVAFAVLTIAAVLAANGAILATPLPSPYAFLTHASPRDLAETEWQEWVSRRFTFDPSLYLALKVPTWIALLTLLGSAIALARSKPDANAPRA